jgi:hypothetical protein
MEDTFVLMADKSSKNIKELKIGDSIINSIGRITSIISIKFSHQQLYRIDQDSGDSYIVFRDSILALKSKDNETMNISVKEYLNTNTSFKRKYLGYYHSMEYSIADDISESQAYKMGEEEPEVKHITKRILYASRNIRYSWLVGVCEKMGVLEKYNDGLSVAFYLYESDNSSFINFVRGLGLLVKIYKNARSCPALRIFGDKIYDMPWTLCSEYFLEKIDIDDKFEQLTKFKITNIGIHSYPKITLEDHLYLLTDYTVRHDM